MKCAKTMRGVQRSARRKDVLNGLGQVGKPSKRWRVCLMLPRVKIGGSWICSNGSLGKPWVALDTVRGGAGYRVRVECSTNTM